MQEHEQRIIDVLSRDTIITNPYDYENYQLVIVGKPICSCGGECKTDVYALYENCSIPGEQMELKISAKKSNAQFLESKVDAIKAENLLGQNWFEILSSAIPLAFDIAPCEGLYSPQKHGNTQAGSLLLGYKLDLMSVPGGRSFPLVTTYEDKLKVLAGRDEYGSILSFDKTNPTVNGVQIASAGCADYMFVGNDNPQSAQEIIDGLVEIEEYAYNMGDIYGALKADNFRMWENKFENRPLSVYVDWFVNDNGMLDGALMPDLPLSYKARDVKEVLDECLAALGVQTPDDLIPGVTIAPEIIVA